MLFVETVMELLLVLAAHCPAALAGAQAENV